MYSVDSEGAIIEALRFGNADIAFMDAGSAWVGWKEYGLTSMAVHQKSDGRTTMMPMLGLSQTVRWRLLT